MADDPQTQSRQRHGPGSRESGSSTEERLRLALDAAELGTFSWYPADDRTDADERMLAIFGLAPEGSITLASALAELIHADDRARYADAVAACLSADSETDLSEEIRVVRANGERWVHVRGRTTFAGDPPRPVRLDGTVKDITAQKDAEQTLKENQERLVLALEAAKQGTFVWHPLEDRGEPDTQMLALFGLPEDGSLNLAAALAALIHPDDAEAYAQAVARSVDPSGDGSLRHDLRIVLPDGTERWVEIAAHTTFGQDPPQPVRMAGVATDISERKKAEAREAEARENEAEMLREQRRVELERRDLASRFQRSLLPRVDVRPRGVRLCSLYQPGETRMLLGGDFFDAFPLSDGRLALMIGDVAGHGPESASLAVALRASWRALLLSGTVSSDTVIAALNEIALAEQASEEAFATVCVCKISAERDELVWSSAGHPAPIVDSSGTIGDLKGIIAPPLGIAPRANWPRNSVRVAAGDRILLHTDGLTEGRARPDDQARLGLPGLLDALRQISGEPFSHGTLKRLVDDITASNGEALPDDVAILAVEIERQ
jgi:PAS domain S-box-containing protein